MVKKKVVDDTLDKAIAQAKEVLVLHEISNGNDIKSINKMVDDLMAFLLKSYTVPVKDPKVISQLFTDSDRTTWLTTEFLSSLESGLVPLFVIKNIMGVHKVPVDAPKLKNWQDFYNRYMNCLPEITSTSSS